MTGRCTGLACPACGVLLFRYPGKRPPATTTGYLRCIVGDAVPVERAQGVARAWIDGLLWRPAQRSLGARVDHKSDGEADRPLGRLGPLSSWRRVQ